MSCFKVSRKGLFLEVQINLRVKAKFENRMGGKLYWNKPLMLSTITCSWWCQLFPWISWSSHYFKCSSLGQFSSYYLEQKYFGMIGMIGVIIKIIQKTSMRHMWYFLWVLWPPKNYINCINMLFSSVFWSRKTRSSLRTSEQTLFGPCSMVCVPISEVTAIK